MQSRHWNYQIFSLNSFSQTQTLLSKQRHFWRNTLRELMHWRIYLSWCQLARSKTSDKSLASTYAKSLEICGWICQKNIKKRQSSYCYRDSSKSPYHWSRKTLQMSLGHLENCWFPIRNGTSFSSSSFNSVCLKSSLIKNSQWYYSQS